ncbi:FAD-dependent thymidylate synthase [Candidatus Margulisiibacteriota bacterium]
MEVLLAGYNLDSTVIEELKQKAGGREDITPETLSASYARISRDPRSIPELREAARKEVEKTRRSNKAIIFKMGHHSVAEHAVFNFDILGISRLALEEMEHFRLAAYTEKSQRYITLKDDFVIPEEINSSKHKDAFIKLVKEQNALYHELFGKLKEHVFKKHTDLAKDPKNQSLLEGWAKEDARYVTALATEGQLGFTVNARTLELLFRRFASHELAEVRALGKALFATVEKIAPSIILFKEANDYDQKTYPELVKLSKKYGKKTKANGGEVELIQVTEDPDNTTAAAILHSSSAMPFDECIKTARAMKAEEKKDLFKTACSHMEFYDKVLREFEYADMTFSLTISASCFAQLKRHRLASLTCQKYRPELGITMPESIKEIKAEKEFNEIIDKTNECYSKLLSISDTAAQYCLTNAHRRRVLFKMNAREFYHISRLREDNHAQWDIKNISAEMSRKAKKAMPLTMLLIGGKDNYPKLYEEVFGRPPKITNTGT